MSNFVAEIGINHNGHWERVIEIADQLKGYADVVKLQHMTPKEFLTPDKYAEPHPVPENSFGKTYGLHKEALNLTQAEHAAIRDHLLRRQIAYACSVCDVSAAQEIIELNPAYIKIPSCRASNKKLIEYVTKNWDGPLHISFGMSTLAERKHLLFLANTRPNTVLYDATSDYSMSGGPIFMTSKSGFSCHDPSIAYGIIAASRGISWIEYHVTLDRLQKGTDHKFSLLPDEFRQMVNLAQDTERIQNERPAWVHKSEVLMREKMWAQ